MEQSVDFLIRSHYAQLRNSEKKVADVVLKQGRYCQKMTIERLAQQSGVSQPTVMRFVKAVGFQSYREFQDALLCQDMKTRMKPEDGSIQSVLYGYRLHVGDSIESVPGKVVSGTIAMLEEMLKSIPASDLQEAVRMVTAARKVHIFCVENSAATAADLMTKLLYLGIECQYYADYYLQRISASSLQQDDTVIAISYSGQSRDVVDTVKIAKKAGAKVVVITNFEQTLLERWGDVVLKSSQKQLLYGDAIFSRTTQMALIDMLYMGIILSDYDTYTRRLDQSSKMVQDKAYQ